jgi:hypothetical protein
MKRLAYLLLFPLLCPACLWGDTTLNADVVKKTIVFLYAAKPDGTVDEEKPMGTGFFVMIPINFPGQVQKGSSLVLVTARHMVDPNWAVCLPQPERPPDQHIFIRVNNKHYDPEKDQTGVGYLQVDLVKDGVKRYFVRDDDKRVDAAVVDLQWPRWGKMQEEYDFLPIPLALFASSDEVARLKIGDSIASAGLVPGQSGEKRNYPFFKFGEISNIPDEPTKVDCRVQRVWFTAINLVNGNSGSPIFYTAPPIRSLVNSVSRAVIIGVQSGSIIPADLAAMTPIEDVFKIIERVSPPNADLTRGDTPK